MNVATTEKEKMYINIFQEDQMRESALKCCLIFENKPIQRTDWHWRYNPPTLMHVIDEEGEEIYPH